MGINKFIKASILSCLLISGTILSGCKEEKSGVTWLSGTEEPRNKKGSNGDFYLNIETKEVFKKVKGSWILIGTLENKDDGYIIKNGKYIYEQELGDFLIQDIFYIGDNETLIKYEQMTKSFVESGTLLSDLNLMPITVDDNKVIEVDQMISGKNDITLEANTIYTFDNTIATSYGYQRVVGKVKGDGTIQEMDIYEIKNNTGYIENYEFINDIMIFNMSGVERSFIITSVDEEDAVGKLDNIVYVKEDEKAIVYGVYTDDKGNAVSISENIIYVYLDGKRYSGEFNFFDGSVTNGYMYFDSKFEDVEIVCGLDLFSRKVKFNVINYNLDKNYYDVDYSNYLKIEGDKVSLNEGEQKSYTIYDIEEVPSMKYIVSEDNSIKYLIDWLNDAMYLLEEDTCDYLGKVFVNSADSKIYYDRNGTLVDLKKLVHYVYLDTISLEISFVDEKITVYDYANGQEGTVSFEDIVDGSFKIDEITYILTLSSSGEITDIEYN